MILFENVTKKYRGTQKPALEAIDLKVDRGEFVFIVGASGSGKSSCLRLILREDQPTSGQIHVAGQDLSKISSRKVPYFRRGVGTVFQDFRLLANKTVFDNVAFTLQVIGKSRGFIQEAVPDTLEMVGLAGKAKRYPHELSGGEQQRVAIARAIVNKPAILLADEPTGNLDPATSLGIMQLLKAINASGTTVVMATHEATFVDIMQQRVVELSQGVVVRDEVGGGYGHTASIPVSELTETSARVLRTSEDVVRSALSPSLGDASASEAGLPADAEPAAPTSSSDSIAQRPEEPSQPQRPAGSAAQDKRIPAFLENDEHDGSGEPPTDTSSAEPQESPMQVAESGGFAERLGLREGDDHGNVGPVR
ncbi:MAG: cell division ATP-binding protein FtsE [Leucobacter sp.]